MKKNKKKSHDCGSPPKRASGRAGGATSHISTSGPTTEYDSRADWCCLSVRQRGRDSSAIPSIVCSIDPSLVSSARTVP